MIPTSTAQWGLAGFFASIVVAFVYAVLRGHLVVKSVVADIRKDRDDRLAEALKIIDLWKDAAEKRDKALAELVPAIQKLAENDETIEALLRAIKKAVNIQVGGDNV